MSKIDHESNGINVQLPKSIAEFCLSAEGILLLSWTETAATWSKIKDALKPGLNWEYITEIAIEHRLAPLLYYSLKKIDDGTVPQEIMKTLHKTYVQSLAHSIVISRELADILKALSDMQIEVIVLKGAALASTIYPDIALRPYGDIDLLVREHDRNKTEAVFSQLGYGALHNYRLGFSEKLANQTCYTKGMASIDLHWHITGLPHSKYIDVYQFWKSAVPVNIDGVDTLILCPEHLLLHLCVHNSKHYYLYLYQLVDISELIHHYNLDWELILEETQRYRLDFPMRYALSFVERLFDSQVPAFVLERLHSYRASSFEERFFDVLSNPDIADHRKNSIAKFLAVPGVKPKVQYIFSQLFPRKERLLPICPGNRAFTAYCLRGSDIIADVVRVILKLAWRPRKAVSNRKSG